MCQSSASSPLFGRRLPSSSEFLVRSLATTPEKKEKEPSRWEKIRSLFKEHGVAFAAVYCGAYTVTLVPIMGALTVGGVDGIELVLWGAEKMQIPYDLSWLSNGVLSKDLVNAFIALELNGWVEPVRLPMVIAATPKASAWLKEKRGQNVPAPEASLSPAERARAKNKAKKKA